MKNLFTEAKTEDEMEEAKGVEIEDGGPDGDTKEKSFVDFDDNDAATRSGIEPDQLYRKG